MCKYLYQEALVFISVLIVIAAAIVASNYYSFTVAY